MSVIIRHHTWISLLFSFKVSIVHVIWFRLVILFSFSTLLTILYYEIDNYHYLANYTNIYDYIGTVTLPTIDFLPASIIGFIIALYLGFANTSAYDRWWEARKLWGSLVNVTRSLARQVSVLLNDYEVIDPSLKQEEVIKEIQKGLIKGIIAFVYLFKNSLRHTNDNKKELESYLTFEEISYLINQYNKPNGLLLILEKKLILAYKKNYINTYFYNLLSQQLVELTNILGACERINNTPLPIPYKVLVNRLVVIFCYTLPFSLIKTSGVFTPFVVFLLGYTLLGLAALIDELEMPFGYESNDLPLNAIARTIEINLLQVLGENDLPSFLTPDRDGVLH